MNELESFSGFANTSDTLEEISVRTNALQSDNISVLGRLTNLKRLYFSENEIDDDGYAELFSSPFKL